MDFSSSVFRGIVSASAARRLLTPTPAGLTAFHVLCHSINPINSLRLTCTVCSVRTTSNANSLCNPFKNTPVGLMYLGCNKRADCVGSKKCGLGPFAVPEGTRRMLRVKAGISTDCLTLFNLVWII